MPKSTRNVDGSRLRLFGLSNLVALDEHSRFVVAIYKQRELLPRMSHLLQQ